MFWTLQIKTHFWINSNLYKLDILATLLGGGTSFFDRTRRALRAVRWLVPKGCSSIYMGFSRTKHLYIELHPFWTISYITISILSDNHVVKKGLPCLLLVNRRYYYCSNLSGALIVILIIWWLLRKKHLNKIWGNTWNVGGGTNVTGLSVVFQMWHLMWVLRETIKKRRTLQNWLPNISER